MSFTLNMDEDVLFKHPCSVKNAPGTLYLTTLRVTWVPQSAGNAAKIILFPWVEVQDDKYSKSNDAKKRCMIRLVTMSGEAFVFNLTGQPSDVLRDELERAKIAVKKGRNQSQPKEHTYARRSRSGASDSGLTTVENEESSRHYRTESKRQEDLLEADSELRRLHKELVGGGVVENSEFWAARSQLLSDLEGRDVASHRGMTSSLLCDVHHAEVTEDGVRKFQLTPEAVADIFMMYPKVLEEYNAKVPVEMTKDEFWVRYFQHEVYVKNKEIVIGKESAKPSSSCSGTKSMRSLSDRVSSEVDLSRTYGDYHVPERLDPEDKNFHPSSTTEKYVRKSSLVLEKQFGKSNSHIARDEISGENLLRESNSDDEIPLRFSSKKRGIDIMMDVSEKTPITLQSYIKQARKCNICDLFPSPNEAIKCLKDEQDKLDSYTEIARGASYQEGRGSSYNANIVGSTYIGEKGSKVFSLGQESMQTTPEMEQFIRDQYKHVSELLIHFYVIISHGASNKTVAGCSNKISKIQKRLEERLEALQRKKNWIKENSSAIGNGSKSGNKILSHTFRYMKDIADLIHRAFDYWDNFQRTQAQ